MCGKFLALDQACALLRDGAVIAFPTETFYGLACDALNPDAVGAVYAIKRRPYGLPLPVIVSGSEALPLVARHIPPITVRLAEAFWPGPLSIILDASDEVPDLLTAGTGRIAVRHSPHPAAVALCRESGLVLTASSANVSGQPPVNRPEELDPDILARIAGIYDAPPYPLGGEPSTVVDILSDGGEGTVRILREGAVDADTLRNAGFSVVVAL